MAKRRRLTPPPFGADSLEEGPPPAAPDPVAPAPIARQAGQDAASAALSELAQEMAAARSEGRLVQALPLAAIDEGWIVRDRVALDPEALGSLVESLRAHGQRSPIEVVDHGPAAGPRRYGLISGWRRLTALRHLAQETGEARFGTVLALLRRPESAGAAYVAMVEENEIRAGLSYYERARIAAKAVEAGVFPDTRSALQRLYGSASRARRSKIGSFLALHGALEGTLAFPEAIPERLGLALAMRLEKDPEFAPALRARLADARPAAASGELAALTAALKGPLGGEAPPKPRPEGVDLRFREGEIRLSGQGVTAGFRDALAQWLSARNAD